MLWLIDEIIDCGLLLPCHWRINDSNDYLVAMATQLLKENQDKYMFSKRKFSSKVLMCSDRYDILISSINV